MRKKVLIISSNNTGHGHKSITESLCEKVNTHLAEIHVVDGFSLGGPFLLSIGKSYGPITRKSESLWKMIWDISAKQSTLVNHSVEVLIRKNFLKLLDEVNPDVILSVHPNFVGSILNILEKEQIKIPFITLIADLVNISPLWADRRSDFIICPTKEARFKCLEYGIPNEQIKMFEFPVRSRFFQKSPQTKAGYEKGQPFTCLLMSGGEGVGNMKSIAENLLEYFNCIVKIVAGRNEKLRARLEESLTVRYGDKVEIYGFTENIQELMLASDIAITRGSPNVMFEAIASNTPLVITGALPGQEQDNPFFVEKSNLGVICKNPNEIQATITQLLEQNGNGLKQIIKCQKEFIHSNAPKDILKFILEVGDPKYQKAIQ